MEERCLVQEKNIDLIIGNGNQRQGNEEWYKNEFIIPNYQRGYRWTQSEVRQLLDDIYAAMKSLTEKYCLQPVVLLRDTERDAPDGEKFFFGEDREHTKKSWQVIDGQQRLTTVFLLLQYLSTVDITADCYDLKYETRKNTNKKLKTWVENVINYNPRKGGFPTIEFDDDDNLDIYYMSNALEVIQQWFSGAGNELKKNFNDYLRKNVFMLWYEFDVEEKNDNEAISLFARINMGKIPLTVAELLKAILLKKKPFQAEIIEQSDDVELAQQKKRRNEQMQKLAEEQQFQRAVEWDRMENALSDNGFFRFIYAEKTPFETRMDYLFRLEYLLDTKMQKSIIPDKEEIFRYYENMILQSNDYKKLDELWERITGHFHLLQEWYNDRVAFHKIGFIIACSKSSSVVALYDLITLYNQSEGKSNFYEEILDVQIRAILQQKLKERNAEKFYLEDIDNLTYEANKAAVQIVLLLFNVLTAMQSPDYRFAFEYVYPLEEGASIEHIFPQTPRIDEIVSLYEAENGKSKDVVMQRANAVKAFVENVKSEFAQIGKSIPEKDPEGTDDSLALWWAALLEILGINSASVQGIGNLAMISKNLNTKLTNNMFFAKQERIKEFDKLGEFIPICTHNAFLKYYSIGGDQSGGRKTSGVFWEEKDMAYHLKSIKGVLKKYLPSKMSKEGVTNE